MPSARTRARRSAVRRIPALALLAVVSFLTVLTMCSIGTVLSAAPARASVDVLPADPLAAFDEKAGDPPPETAIVPVTGVSSFRRALQVSVARGPSSPYRDGESEIRIGARTAAPAQAGHAMVATFWVRAVDGQGTRSRARFHVERAGGDYRKSVSATLRFGPSWQRFELPFRMAESYPAGGAQVSLWLGYGRQVIQLAGLSVRDLGAGDPAGPPAVSFDGREPDAPWRAAADARIDQYRKGDLTVRVVDRAGDPVAGAAVRVDLRRHAFAFGSAMDARLLRDASATGATYRRRAASDFNQGVLGNDLKWPAWEDEPHRQNHTIPALRWIREQEMQTRGHTLVWPGWRYLPPDVRSRRDDPAALRSRIDDHVTAEVTALRGSVDTWDVVNEPYAVHDLQDALGPDEIGRWFRLAHRADPNARLVLNDYDLLENNGWNTRHQDHDIGLVRSLLDKGVPVQGVGLQSHFGPVQLTPPGDVVRVLDRFAELGLPLEITEFDVSTTDERLQADYTRDFLTAVFSHPAVTGVTTWGFWEASHWSPDAAMYRADWSPKPNARVWQNLIRSRWWTSASGRTGAGGRFAARGFLGDYQVSATVDGKRTSARVAMPTNDGSRVRLVVDAVRPEPGPSDRGTSRDDQPMSPVWLVLVAGGMLAAGALLLLVRILLRRLPRRRHDPAERAPAEDS